MSQGYAAVWRSIWLDPDFRALTVAEQHAYLMLISHPDRNAAGVLSLTPRKWTKLAADLTAAGLKGALAELDDAAFIVMDEETEEVLVRAFIRRAKVYTNTRLLVMA